MSTKIYEKFAYKIRENFGCKIWELCSPEYAAPVARHLCAKQPPLSPSLMQRQTHLSVGRKLTGKRIMWLQSCNSALFNQWKLMPWSNISCESWKRQTWWHHMDEWMKVSETHYFFMDECSWFNNTVLLRIDRKHWHELNAFKL